MPDRYTRINAHGHLLPEPHEIPDFMRRQEIFWVDDDRTHMRQQGWARPVTDPSFFRMEKLAWMERMGIDHEVVLNLSQLYGNGLSRQLADDVLRFQNDFNARVQAEHPDKFTTGFVVQPAYTDLALREIERCVEELGLHLLCLPTHYLTPEGVWQSVADESVAPIFELANRYKLAVEIHPYDGPRMIQLRDRNWRFHLVWMCAQTADTYHLFTLLDFDDQYPDVRTCFAHGNQFGQINVGRRRQGYEGRPDLFEGTKHPDYSNRAGNLYFDTLVHDLLSLELLVRRQGDTQIVAGLDDPYPLGEMEDGKGGYPGKLLDDAVVSGLLTGEQRQRIWRDNVLAWLGAEARQRILTHAPALAANA